MCNWFPYFGGSCRCYSLQDSIAKLQWRWNGDGSNALKVRCFAFIAPFLAEHYHVVAMDMSGMGDSGWREDYDEETRVRELISVAETNDLICA